MANESERERGSRAIARRETELPAFRPLGGGAFLSPFALLREMTDWMDQAFEGDLPLAKGERLWSPAVEVRERDSKLVVCADLPGVEQKDLKVEVDNNTLVIQGERKREQTQEREGFRRSERTYGTFYRAIPLPEGVKADEAKADFKNGVLEVTVPIPENKAHRRQIPISAQQESGSRQPETTSKR
ncbi:MAG: Hsp20/alpha crystallin family protein [Bryobacteraceae bacterium]